LVGHSLLGGFDDGEGLFRVATPPFQQARPCHRDPHVFGDLRLEPFQQLVGCANGAPAHEPAGDQ
jgi:hypothetical protein